MHKYNKSNVVLIYLIVADSFFRSQYTPKIVRLLIIEMDRPHCPNSTKNL